MLYFVYKLTNESLNDYKLAYGKVHEIYKDLEEQLTLLSSMVNDESELKGMRNSLRISGECLKFLSLIKKTGTGEYSGPIDRTIVNYLMSELKDSGPEFKKFFSHFELKKLKNKNRKEQTPFRVGFLRSHFLKNNKFNVDNSSAIKPEVGSLSGKRRLSL